MANLLASLHLDRSASWCFLNLTPWAGHLAAPGEGMEEVNTEQVEQGGGSGGGGVAFGKVVSWARRWRCRCRCGKVSTPCSPAAPLAFSLAFRLVETLHWWVYININLNIFDCLSGPVSHLSTSWVSQGVGGMVTQACSGCLTHTEGEGTCFFFGINNDNNNNNQKQSITITIWHIPREREPDFFGISISMNIFHLDTLGLVLKLTVGVGLPSNFLKRQIRSNGTKIWSILRTNSANGTTFLVLRDTRVDGLGSRF